MIDKAIKLIKKHEGFSQYPYKDTVGKITIGYGRNLNDVGISKREAELMLENDIYKAIIDLLDIFNNFYDFPENVQIALIDMIYNLGKTRFLTFKKMIKALKEKDYKRASQEAQDSKWCKQVKNRCKEIVKLFYKGNL